MRTLLDQRSLGSTVDAIAERLFLDELIPVSQRKAVALWIASRQGLPGSYADTFAPMEKDTLGIRLFTGEVVRTRVGMAHILGEECCRVLFLLGVKDQPVQDSLNRAVCGLAARIQESERQGYSRGTYCCGTCSVAYWRNLAIRLLPRAEARLRLGLKELKNSRNGAGKWRRFPFFYTCLALTEIGPRLAKLEMQYASSYWLRNMKKLSLAKDRTAKRRAAVGQRLLEMCER